MGIGISINMLYGMATVASLALVAMIGTLSDTKNRGGFKWFLVFLIIAGAGAGGAREYLLDKSAKRDQEKLDDAVASAKSANGLADEKIRSNAQSFAKEREGLESAIKQSRASSMALVEQIASLADSIEVMEKAAAKEKEKEIADLGMQTRLDASKKLVAIAKDGQWMEPSDITNLEAWFKEELPLQSKQYKKIQESLGEKPISGGEVTE